MAASTAMINAIISWAMGKKQKRSSKLQQLKNDANLQIKRNERVEAFKRRSISMCT